MTKLFRILIGVIASLICLAPLSAQSLPEFSLKCSDAGSQSSYRLASNGTEIYFASIDNKLIAEDVKQSIDNFVEPRNIIMSLRDSSAESRRPRMALENDNTHEVQGNLARDTLVFRMGKHRYTCEKIVDLQIFSTLKLAYENSIQEAIQKQKTYNNRPNQL